MSRTLTPEQRKRAAAREKAWRKANQEHVKAYGQAHYQANREYVLAQNKKWREANSARHRANAKAYAQANRKQVAACKKTYYQANRERITAYKRAWNQANSKAQGAKAKAWRKANREYSAEIIKAWTKANPERVKGYKKKWMEANKEDFLTYAKAYHKERYQTDSRYRLRMKLSNRLWHALRRAMAEKSASTMALVGRTVNRLMRHLEGQFKPGMTWQNYGEVWHVDHIRPCASFNLCLPAQQRECFHWSNLQPLFGPENIRKGSHWNGQRHFYASPAELSGAPRKARC